MPVGLSFKVTFIFFRTCWFVNGVRDSRKNAKRLPRLRSKRTLIITFLYLMIAASWSEENDGVERPPALVSYFYIDSPNRYEGPTYLEISKQPISNQGYIYIYILTSYYG